MTEADFLENIFGLNNILVGWLSLAITLFFGSLTLFHRCSATDRGMRLGRGRGGSGRGAISGAGASRLISLRNPRRTIRFIAHPGLTRPSRGRGVTQIFTQRAVSKTSR